LVQYAQKNSDPNSQIEGSTIKRVVSSYTAIVVQILIGLKDLQDQQFQKYLSFFYPAMSELILVDSKDIKEVLKDIFGRIGKMTNII